MGRRKNKKNASYSFIAILFNFYYFFSFALVNFYSFIQEKRKIKTRLKNNESYILFWLNKNIKSIESQIKNIKDFHDELKEWNSIELISYGIIKLPLAKLQELSSLEIYSTFVINKKGLDTQKHKNYSDLINGIEYLERKENEIKERIISFFKHNSEYRQEMSRTHMELEENRIKILQTGLSNLHKDEFLNKYYQHNDQNESTTLKNIREMYEKYMIPLNILCKEMLLKYPNDTRIPNIQRIVFLFRRAYDSNDAPKKQLEKSLLEIMDVLIDYKYKLEKIKLYLHSLKFKAIFNLN